MGKWIEISPWACFMGALALLTLPFSWILALISAALIHELGHVAMLLLLGIGIDGITGGCDGLRIHTELMQPWKELLCALAGPMASFSLLFFSRWFPLTALCALIQGLYNLLPVLPFDGGRVLYCLLELVCPARADRLMGMFRLITICLIAILGLWAAIGLNFGFWAVLVMLFLLQKVHPRKRPCKDAGKRVQ